MRKIESSPLRPVLRVGGFLAVALGLAPLAARAAQPTYVPNQVIVQFRAGTTESQKDQALHGIAARVHARIHTPAMRAEGAPGLTVADTPSDVPGAIAALQHNPNVEFAEPNWIYTTTATSNDPYYTGGYLWGMYGSATSPSNPYGTGAGTAWANGYTGSKNVYVGIVDTGIQYTHPDIANNIWTNPYDAVDGIDNDGNGYIDDTHGWDFFNGDNTIYDGSSDDHGTHVAGTIGGVGGNGQGVAGVNWNVTLINGKFIGPNGGSTSDAVSAIDYMTNLKTQHGLNIVALNNSWGGGGFSQALLDAITRAAKQNILFIAAAGNNGTNNDTTANYPSNYNTTSGAGYDSVIAVAAIDSNGNLASWSDYGSTTVDLGAPGVGIYSSVPVDTYASYSGTSMATPHVTGAAALYASAHPGATAQQIRSAILGSVTATASLSGKTVTGGRLNIAALMGGSAPAPSPVYDVAVNSVSAPSSVAQGQTANVNVQVANNSTVTETLNVTLTDTGAAASGTVSPTQSVSLSAGQTTTLTFTWNTTNASTGTHTLTASVAAVTGETNTGDNSRSTTSNVTAPVAGVTVSAISPNSMRAGSSVNVTITGSGFASGATVSFQNGSGPTPSVSNVQVVSSTQITATVSAKNGGARGSHVWDVVVTNPNGASGRLTGGFTVVR